MGIILKHTFKNIFQKFGRTFLLTFCIFMCSLAATLCLDMTKSVERLFSNMIADTIGSTDIVISTQESLSDEWTEGMPEMEYLKLFPNSMMLHRRDPELYSYAIEDNLNIMAFDLEKGYNMKFLLTELDLKDDETAMTEEIAELYGYEVGDKISFYDMAGDEVEFTIAQLIKKGGIVLSNTCVISFDALDRLYSQDIKDYANIYVNIINDNLIDSAYDTLKEKYPEMDIVNVKHDEELEETIKRISNLFLTIFAVCLIVVVIITITISERIMSERLPVAGTLRSLGVSSGKTTAILLLENIIYALMGSLPAMLVYSLIRDIVLDGLFTIEGEVSPDFGNVSVMTYITVVVGAIFIECICTLKETLIASRMAIRDIIFQGHNSEYKFSNSKTIIGAVCIVFAITGIFFNEVFIINILCFVGAVVGVYLLFPYIVVYASKALSKLFTNINMPVASIAGTEISVRKSTIASTSLIAVAAGIAISLFIFADSMSGVMEHEIFDCDLILHCDDEDYMYDYIKDLDGVTETQNIYFSGFSNKIKVNDIIFPDYSVFAMEEGDMFCGVMGVDEPVKENEIYITEEIAEKANVNIGNEIELALNFDFFVPDYFKMKVAGICSTVYMDSSGRGIAINSETFKKFVTKRPGYQLIRTSGNNDEIIEKIRKYSSLSTVDSVETNEHYLEESEKENHSQNILIKMLGFMGIFLTLVGVISNQLIGFESRKRENAVLLSTSMNRPVLRKMLFLETFISSAISLLFAVPFGILLYIPVGNIMHSFGSYVPTTIKIGEYFGTMGILLILFSWTVIFPYVALSRMKLAEQLKYE